MAKTKQLKSQEKFKTMIGGQALIEGIMMRGPDKDAVVVRGKEGLTVEVTPRKLPPEHSPLRWPLIRGCLLYTSPWFPWRRPPPADGSSSGGIT